jgi:hypothetical protein
MATPGAVTLNIAVDNLTPERRRFLIGMLATFPPALPEFSHLTNTEADISAAFRGAVEPPIVTGHEDDEEDEEEQTEEVDVSAVEFDSAGVPWNEAIHSGKKTKNADGTWRLRKGVDKNTVADVEAKLKAVTVAAMPTPPLPMPTPSPNVVAMPTPIVAEAATAADTVTPDKAGLIKTLQLSTQLQTAGSLTSEQVDGIVANCTGNRVTKLVMLATDLASVPAVYDLLKVYA